VDKGFLIEQLAGQLRETARTARQAMAAANTEAREGATAAERREDSRVAQENSGLARGHRARLERANAELAMLDKFRPGKFPPKSRVGLGAVVEVEIEDGEGRTLFLAPAGAGIELTGPGGDGFLSVVTPASPIGRAVLGRRVGDTVEVTVNGASAEWTVTYVE
jgi:transcription elongation GreA/GreB family factor